jgi:hypothetical protein
MNLTETHTTLGQVAAQQAILTNDMKALLDTYPRETPVIARHQVTMFGRFLMGLEIKKNQVAL